MNKIKMALTAMFALVVLVGCQSKGSGDSDEDLADSCVLKNACATNLAKYVHYQKRKTGKMPKEAMEVNYVPTFTAKMKSAYPEIFKTSEALELAFSKGQFVYGVNKNKMATNVEYFKANRVALPGFTKFLIRQFKRDQLRGAELEFAARLLVETRKNISVID